MVSQRCPRCASERVRRGYRPTPVWSKVLFRYNLLCDNCNWEFKGFAVPGTVSTKPTKRQKKPKIDEQNNHIDVVETSGKTENNEPEILEIIDELKAAVENIDDKKATQKASANKNRKKKELK